MSPPVENLSQILLRLLAPARRVLQVGGESALGSVFCAAHPGAVWDTQSEYLTGIEGEYDTVLLNGCLDRLAEPEALLSTLRQRLNPEARLLVVAKNSGHISVVERLLLGDFTTGPKAQGRLRAFTPSSICRLLLDGGWLPNLVDQVAIGHLNQDLVERLLTAAQELGVPRPMAERNLLLSQLIFECKPAPIASSGDDLSLSAIVPLNNILQYNLNVDPSPGLREIGTEFVHIQGAPNAAASFEAGAGAASGEWLLFCHQDVYFPKGSGRALAALLGRIPMENRPGLLLGFAGLGEDALGQPTRAGLVIDRMECFSHPPTNRAISLDEFAVVLHRDSVHKIDPAMGWHLWGTDMCLKAQQMQTPNTVAIARIPIFHNSLNDYALTDSFLLSARRLKGRFPERHPIQTLCGEVL
jgi:hypothetical protein